MSMMIICGVLEVEISLFKMLMMMNIMIMKKKIIPESRNSSYIYTIYKKVWYELQFS